MSFEINNDILTNILLHSLDFRTVSLLIKSLDDSMMKLKCTNFKILCNDINDLSLLWKIIYQKFNITLPPNNPYNFLKNHQYLKITHINVDMDVKKCGIWGKYVLLQVKDKILFYDKDGNFILTMSGKAIYSGKYLIVKYLYTLTLYTDTLTNAMDINFNFSYSFDIYDADIGLLLYDSMCMYKFDGQTFNPFRLYRALDIITINKYGVISYDGSFLIHKPFNDECEQGFLYRMYNSHTYTFKTVNNYLVITCKFIWKVNYTVLNMDNIRVISRFQKYSYLDAVNNSLFSKTVMYDIYGNVEMMIPEHDNITMDGNNIYLINVKKHPQNYNIVYILVMFLILIWYITHFQIEYISLFGENKCF